MATLELRAMSVGETLDGAFTVYRRIFGTLISIAIVCQGIPAVLNIYMELAGGAVQFPALWAIVAILGAVAGLVTAGATVWAISESYLGEAPSLGPALRYALGKLWKLFVAGFIKYLLIGVASLFFLIPGIIVACGYAVVTQIVVLEELPRATAALRRSWSLTKGHKRRAFVLGLVIFTILYIPFVAAGFLVAIFTDFAAAGAFEVGLTVAANLIGLVLYPLIACVFTLFYYDLRVRKEAFDLEHLSRQLAGAPASV